MNREDLIDFLRQFGLEKLAPLVDKAIQDDPTQFTGAFAQEAVMRTVRDTPEYKTRFKGLEYRAAAKLPPINEAQYLQIEDDYRQVLRTNGMPAGFYDTPEDFAKFIGSDVRADELNTRIQQGYRAVNEADPGTKEELKQLYGLQDADLAAFFIDPARSQTEVVKKAQAAQRAAAARAQGFGLNAAQAEELVQRGISQREAQAGFSELAQTQDLYGLTAAEAATGEQAISQEEQIAGVFGTNAAAQQRIATRKRRRQAEFEQGGGFATTQRGVTGLTTVGQ